MEEPRAEKERLGVNCPPDSEIVSPDFARSRTAIHVAFFPFSVVICVAGLL